MVTLAGTLLDAGQGVLDPRRTRVRIESNASTLGAFDAAGHLHLGGEDAAVSADGSFEFADLVSSADIDGLAYQVLVNYPTVLGKGRADWSSGWFPLTADATLAEVASTATPQPVPIETVQQAIDDAVAGAVTDVQQAVTDAQAASGAATGSASAASTSASAAAGSATDAAGSATTASGAATAAQTAQTGAEDARDDAQQAATEAQAALAAHLEIGTVTTGAPGSDATAEITGTAPDQVLNLTIPAGHDGDGSVSSVAGVAPDGAGNVVLDASDVGARPAGDVPWGEVSGKPTTFAPSAHTHAEADITGLADDLAAKVATSSVGAANGVASLDSAGKVPVAQLPAGMMQLKGSWNASTNTPTLADGSGAVGAYYRVSTAGTQNLGSGSQTFGLGDFVIYNDAGQWELSHSGSDLVQSVAGKTGTVVLVKGDVGLGNVDNTSDANKPVSTAQQTALNGKQDTSAKGAANGYASLGSDGKVPSAQLPTTSGASGPLVRVSYAPASTVSTPAGTSVAAVDSTNLAISFTAPSSGKVRVALECGWISAASAFYYWSLLAGGSNLSGSERALDLGTGTTPSARTRIEIAISGLTSGTSYTYTWAHRASAASGGTIRYGGSSSEFTSTNYGPAIMEVYAE